MPTVQTHTFEVSQEDYNDGVRVRYCTFCPNVIFGNVENATVKCLSCLPVPEDPEDPEPVLIYRELLMASYDEASETFMWHKSGGLA